MKDHPASIRRAILLGAALLGLIAPAHGEEPVEAGLSLSAEGSSHLVIDFWPPAGWLVRQSGRLVELEIPGASLAMPVESVALPTADGALVDLGSETRDGATVLAMRLGCDCTLAVRGDGRRLLVEVVESSRAAESLLQGDTAAPRLARVPARRPGSDAPFSDGSGQALERARSRLLEQVREAAEAGFVTLSSPDHGPLRRLRGAVAAAGDMPGGDTAARAAREDPIGDGLEESVGQAARPDSPVVAHLADPKELSGSTVSTPPPTRPTPAPAPSPDEIGISLLHRGPASDCIPSETFVLPDPLPPLAFVEAVSRLRRRLLGEFDRPDPSVALDLARLYLGHGFGAEASRILSEFAPGEPEAPLLIVLARLVEERPLPAPNLLTVQGCGGQHALWQSLDAALGGRPAEAVDLLEASTGALEQVAHGLRGRIAVHLGLAAAEHGDWIAAHRLQAMAARALRADDRVGQEMKDLLAARMLRERGEHGEVTRRIARLRTTRSQAGAEALLLASELALERNAEEISLDQLRLDLGALVTAHRGTSLGDRAFRGELLTTGRLRGRDAALDLLDHGLRVGLIDEARYQELLAEIGATLDGQAGDTPLAVLYEREPGRFSELRKDTGFRHALARSYIALGAPALAERVLRAADILDERIRRDLVAAYVELGDEAAAERLGGDPTDASGASLAERQLAPGQSDAAGASRASAAAGAGGTERTFPADGDWSGAPEAPRAADSPPNLAPSDGGARARQTDTLESDPEELALRMALSARRAGLKAPPPEALALSAADPALQAGLRAIFRDVTEGGGAASGERLTRTLEEISAEVRTYREVLKDG